MNEEENNMKGIILATLLCALVIIISRYLFPVAEITPQTTEQAKISEQTATAPAIEETQAESEIFPVDQILSSAPRINIENEAIEGSLRVQGARFDDLLLRKYKQTLSADSADVELLAPAKTKSPYYAEFGWLSTQKGVKTPNKDTIWTVKGKQLTPDTPIVMEYNAPQGLRFIRTVSLDKNYMFTITDSVENNSNQTSQTGIWLYLPE